MKKGTQYNNYNIYKVPVEKKQDLIEHLLDRQFEKRETNEKCINDIFEKTILACDKDNSKGLQWINLINAYTNDPINQEAKVYGAIVMYHNEETCYVISFGNAHFYLSKFCDMNFGINIAERLIDLKKVKSQQNICSSNKLNRNHMDFLKPTAISLRSGQVPSFVEGESILAEKWGKRITCGYSAQFKWEDNLLNLSQKLNDITHILTTPPLEPLPQLHTLHTKDAHAKIEELNHQLVEAIDKVRNLEDIDLFCLPSFYIVGTKIIQSDLDCFQLKHPRIQSFNVTGNIEFSHVLDYWNVNNINTEEGLFKTKISAEYALGQRTKQQPILEYIEFITQDNYCLRNGKWHLFNESYQKSVIDSVSKISFSNHTDGELAYCEESLLSEYKSPSDLRNEYETYYNQHLSSILGMTCLHPNLHDYENIKASRKTEICDLYNQNTLVYVKIGETGIFAQAVDQALLTLDKIKNNTLTFDEGTTSNPRKIRFILVYKDKKKKIKNWNDIKSLNFLVHLAELREAANFAGIELHVDFVYRTNPSSITKAS